MRAHACVSMCENEYVCMCVREREREGGRDGRYRDRKRSDNGMLVNSRRLRKSPRAIP